MSIELHQQSNTVEAAQALANAVAADLQATLAQKGEAVLAVSGGRSPIPFFELLSQKDLAWNKVFITLVDERIVPNNHTDSNTGLAQQYLLQNKATAATWIPVVSANASEADLVPEAVVRFALQHYKQPDVLILGMGGDGHTASLFPQAPQLDNGLDLNNATPLLHTTPVTAPHERVSMTLAAILNTPHIYLAISGADKKAVFDQAAQGANKQYPISFILNNEKVACHVFYSN